MRHSRVSCRAQPHSGQRFRSRKGGSSGSTIFPVPWRSRLTRLSGHSVKVDSRVRAHTNADWPLRSCFAHLRAAARTSSGSSTVTRAMLPVDVAKDTHCNPGTCDSSVCGKRSICGGPGWLNPITRARTLDRSRRSPQLDQSSPRSKDAPNVFPDRDPHQDGRQTTAHFQLDCWRSVPLLTCPVASSRPYRR